MEVTSDPSLGLETEPPVVSRTRRAWSGLVGAFRQARGKADAPGAGAVDPELISEECDAVTSESEPPAEAEAPAPFITGITPLVPEPCRQDAAVATAAGVEAPLEAVEEAPPTVGERGAPKTPGTSPTAMMARMAEALQAHAALMERYARAGYHIGRLEAENRALNGDKEKLAARITDLELRLSESKLNEQVLQAERDRALQVANDLTLRMAEHGIKPVGRWQALTDFVMRHW